MDRLIKYRSCEDASEKDLLKQGLFKEALKGSYIMRDLDTKATFLKKEIAEKALVLKDLNSRLNAKEEEIMEIVKEVGTAPKNGYQLALPAVVFNCKKSLVLEVDPSFNEDNFLNYEMTVICSTEAEKEELKKFLEEKKLRLKSEDRKIETLSLKHHLKSFALKGARLINSFSLTYKFK